MSFSLGKNTKRIRQAGKRRRAAINPTFPQRMQFNVRFGDFYNLSGGSGIVVQSFRLNSIYDPDITGVGGQPMHYTELAATYGRYKVTAADVSVTYINWAPQSAFVGFVWHPSPSTPLSSITQTQQVLLEGSNSMSAFLSPHSANGGPYEQVTLKKHLDLTRVQGCVLDDVYEGDFGANPLANISLDVVSIDPLGVENQATVAMVQIQYFGEVYGLKNTYLD